MTDPNTVVLQNYLMEAISTSYFRCMLPMVSHSLNLTSFSASMLGNQGTAEAANGEIANANNTRSTEVQIESRQDERNNNAFYRHFLDLGGDGLT